MRKIVLLALLVTFASMTAAWADDGSTEKLQRGFINVVSAPVEIPKQIRASWIDGSAKTYHISAWLFYGFVKGLWMTPVRMVSGLWDIVTFPLPNNRDGLVRPAYVSQDWPKRQPGVRYHNLGD